MLAHRHARATIPTAVGELGPGDSIGAGLAALLCGAGRYCAFDVVRYASLERNLAVFDELIELLRARTQIPDTREFPESWPALGDYSFPSDLLPDDLLSRSLAPGRIARIRAAIRDANRDDSPVQYVVPWDRAENVRPASVDMVFSQAVMEHVADVAGTYRTIRVWLRPGRIVTQTIDFRSHGPDDRWDGHRTCSGLLGRLIRRNRHWVPNRQPYSRHLRQLADAGLTVVHSIPRHAAPRVRRGQPAREFRDLDDSDLSTDIAFVLGC